MRNLYRSRRKTFSAGAEGLAELLFNNREAGERLVVLNQQLRDADKAMDAALYGMEQLNLDTRAFRMYLDAAIDAHRNDLSEALTALSSLIGETQSVLRQKLTLRSLRSHPALRKIAFNAEVHNVDMTIDDRI